MLCDALNAAQRRMLPTEMQRLRGPWFARASRQPTDDGAGAPYYVLHRVGLGEAFVGTRVEEIIDQIERRWPEPVLDTGE